MYVIQSMYSDGYLAWEDRCDDLDRALKVARDEVVSPYSEGDIVRIITDDGELVWTCPIGRIEEQSEVSP